MPIPQRAPLLTGYGRRIAGTGGTGIDNIVVTPDSASPIITGVSAANGRPTLTVGSLSLTPSDSELIADNDYFGFNVTTTNTATPEPASFIPVGLGPAAVAGPFCLSSRR
jgi:hypothetical protein